MIYQEWNAMATNNHPHVLDLLPAYVLDALTDEEIIQVAEHLASCSACQAEYLQLRKVADELPLALRQSVAPPKVKESLMKAIHSHQGSSSHPAALTFWQRLGQLFAKPLVAIGTALILILVIANISLWNQNQRLGQLASQPWQVVLLDNADNTSNAMGELILDSRGEAGTLLVDNLDALGSDYQYQVWLIRKDARVSAGVFSVNQQGYASLIIQASDPLTSYDSIGISVEPFGGSPGPTGTRVLDGNIH
jgi:anti-sigma-K factor RskA